MTNPHVEDVGVPIEADMEEDIHEASTLKIICRKPDGTVVEFTATPKGVIAPDWTIATYTAVAGHFTVPGSYRYNGYAEWSSGSKHEGKAFYQIVEPKARL